MTSHNVARRCVLICYGMFSSSYRSCGEKALMRMVFLGAGLPQLTWILLQLTQGVCLFILTVLHTGALQSCRVGVSENRVFRLENSVYETSQQLIRYSLPLL